MFEIGNSKLEKIILEKKVNCYKINVSKGLYRFPNIVTKLRNVIIANQNSKNTCGVHKYLKIACIILANQNSKNICGAHKYL